MSSKPNWQGGPALQGVVVGWGGTGQGGPGWGCMQAYGGGGGMAEVLFDLRFRAGVLEMAPGVQLCTGSVLTSTQFKLSAAAHFLKLPATWAHASCSCTPSPPPLAPLQERADDEHTTRGMRLVQAEVDAISKGWPLGDGIALFGVGSSRSGLPGAGGASGKRQQQLQESSVELNANAGMAGGSGGSSSSAPQPVTASRPPLFGSAASSSSAAAGDGAGGGRSSSPPSKAAVMREKYGNRSSGSLAGAAAAAAPGAAGPSERRRPDAADDGGAVDALFAGVESRPARQTGSQRLLDQPADSSSSSYAMPFSWKRGR